MDFRPARFVAALALSCGLAMPLAVARPDEKTTEEILAALGESPVAALLDMLGADVKRYEDHVTTLANPFFEGRAPGTNGNRLAADYIEFNFRRFGLEPAFPTTAKDESGGEVVTENASFRQPFTQGSELKVRKEEVAYRTQAGKTVALVSGTDYNVLGLTGAGEISSPIVFAGYSIVDGKDGYQSYPEGADLSGKIALVMRFEPMDEAGHSKWADQAWSPDAALDSKIRNAAERHASGVILVNPPGADDPRTTKLETVRSVRGRAVDVPVVMMSIDATDALVKAADQQGRSLLELRKVADESGGLIDLPNARVSLSVDAERIPNATDNVGAVLRGRGPLADQYVVVGAHYDHVGYGYFGADQSNAGKIHPGADDNASGTSGMLLMAERLSEHYAELPSDASVRSVLFLGFSAEESGLNGSRHYVDHPTIPLDKITLMINLDMIGRLTNNRLELEGVTTGEGLEEFTKPFIDSSGIEVKLGGARIAQNSDHASFMRQNVPILFFFTGTHPQYHKPEDVASLINPVGATRIVTMAQGIALEAAFRPEPFKFTGEQTGGDPSPGLAMKVRFGIAPGDYSGDTKGVLVGGVTDGTTAAEAGVQKDDLITKWNGVEVTDVESWMGMLAKHNPGDVVEVTVLRKGQEIALKATMKARQSGNR